VFIFIKPLFCLQYYKLITNKAVVFSSLQNNKFVLFALAAACGVLIFIAFYFGFYYEDNQVVLVNLLYYAKPNEMLITEWMNDFDFLLVPFWAVLAQKIKTFPFYAVWQLLQAFLWLYAFFYFFIAEVKTAKLWLKIVALLLIVFLGLDSLVNQVCFRNSILLSGAALVFTRQRLLAGIPVGGWPTALFIFSLIPRSHPAAIVLALFMGHEVMMGVGIKKVLKAHVPHLIACFIIIGSYQLYGAFATQNTGKVIEAGYEYAWFEKGAYKPLSDMTTAKDSLKYWAIQQWFMSDSAEINLAFIDRVVDRDKHYNGILSSHTYLKAMEETNRLISTYWYLFSLLFVLAALGVLGGILPNKSWWVVMVYAGIILLLLFFLVNEIKERFLVPFTAVTILILLGDWLGKKQASKYALFMNIVLVCFALVAAFFQWQRASSTAQQFAAADNAAAENIKALNAYVKDKAVLVTMDVPIPEVRNIFHRSKESPYANLAWVEAGYMVYYPYMEARIQNVAGFSALNFRDFLNAIDRNSNLRLIASPSRINVLQKYSKGIYGKNIEFIEDTIQPLWYLPSKAYVLRSQKQ
jgi:hypothetical protein